jgi:hypothetical protein
MAYHPGADIGRHFRLIEVETASIQAMQNYLIGNDKIFSHLAACRTSRPHKQTVAV